MATVEKITYQPLIEHLRNEEDFYNQLLAEFEVKSGHIPGQIITELVVNVIEPVVTLFDKDDELSLSRITKAFFIEFLSLIKTSEFNTNINLYKKTWLLLKQIPNILKQKPKETLNLLGSAVSNINALDRNKTTIWLTYMEQTIQTCSSYNDLMLLGRFLAWYSGLAHLREIAKKSYTNLNDQVKQAIHNQLKIDQEIDYYLNSAWKLPADFGQQKFGGFLGFEKGVFNAPPTLMFVDNTIFATDEKTSCALFADAMGVSFLSNISFNPDSEQESASTGKKNDQELKFSELYSDIKSLVIINNNAIFTRQSSYFVFVQALT